jgi:hypothetical protein
MPRCGLGSARLLHQDVLVEESHRRCAHEFGSQRRQRRVQRHIAVLGNVRPRHVVTPEPDCLLSVGVPMSPTARRPTIVLHASTETVQLGSGHGVAEHGNPVALVVLGDRHRRPHYAATVPYRAAVPLTFFAHQLPILPLHRRWPHRLDGVALAIGSMAPDMAYVLDGSRFRVWAHDLPAAILFSVPVALAVSWLLVRLISPVLWDHLPDAGHFHLHDYRGLAAHRFAWGRAAASAAIGALTHVGLDHFTHRWGWFAQNLGWYDTILVDGFLGRRWTFFRIIQYIGHVFGSALCLWLLWRYGRQRWMADAADRVATYPVTQRSRLVIVGAVLAGLALGVGWTTVDPIGNASAILRVAAVCFAALTVASALLQWQRATDRVSC